MYNSDMKITRVLPVLAGCVLLLAGSLVLFPEQGDKKKLDVINKQIQDIGGKLENLKKEEGSILNDIYKIELQYEKAVIENNKIKIQLRSTREKIRKKNSEKEILEREIQKSKKNLKKIIRILYKIGGNSYLKLFIQINSLDELFKNYRLFTALIDYKSDEINKIKRNIRQLNLVKKELETQYDNIRRLQQLKEQKVRNIGGLKQSKLRLMRQVNNDRKNYRQMLDELEIEAGHLNELIYGKKMKRRLGIIDLNKIKGKLPWPITGKVVSSFGKKRSTKFDTYVMNNGIKIEPGKSDNVTAVYGGEIVFADYYKGYGNLVIIQHAKNLYTLYGHCEKILKKTGDSVSAGELISVAGNTGSTYGKVLYFEIRTQLQPQDPLLWLRKKR